MKTSEKVIEISRALKEFQEVVVNAFKEKTGYNYKYAPLDVILKENRPLMAKYGLSHIQSQTYENGLVCVETRIMHESGEWIETTSQSPFAQLKGMNDYQSIGSGITYLRRYSLSAALGIAADEDEDAHGEQEAKKSPPPSKATDTDKKEAWKNFQTICETMGVDAIEFMSSMIDMTDKTAVYAEVRKWLQNEQLLKDQLVSYKNA